jgi:hypothetical protein
MTPNRAGICAFIGVGAVILLYLAYSSSGDNVVPQIQTEAQFLGMNLDGALSTNPGTPLDVRVSTHFWAPGTNPRDSTDAPVVKSRCRYPVIPGGNVSSVMHKGWGSFLADSPTGNDWRLNPPEAAVL